MVFVIFDLKVTIAYVSLGDVTLACSRQFIEWFVRGRREVNKNANTGSAIFNNFFFFFFFLQILNKNPGK